MPNECDFDRRHRPLGLMSTHHLVVITIVWAAQIFDGDKPLPFRRTGFHCATDRDGRWRLGKFKGIHVAYLVIVAAINVPWQRAFQPNKPDDYFISPESIADEVHHLAHQPKDAWSFLAELRPFHEVW